MQPELKAIVKSFGLTATPGDPVFSHAGTAGDWWVGALVTGMGPALAREATRRALVGRTDRPRHGRSASPAASTPPSPSGR